MAIKKLGMTTKRAVDGLHTVCKGLQKLVLQRDQEIRQILLALVCREHVLLYGPTGTAKSYLALNVFRCIEGDGLKTFSIQLNEYMTDDSVFGPVNPKVIREEGVLQHNIENMLPEATFGFLDEFFDASGNLRRSMLEILNERTFSRGRQKLKCPLHTAIATSNYIDRTEESEAVIDRFTFRSQVQKLGVENRSVLISLRSRELPRLQYSDLQMLCDKVDKIVLPKLSQDALVELVTQFESHGGPWVSDRKLRKIVRVLKAIALLDKCEEVSVEHLESLDLVVPVLHNNSEMEAFSKAISVVLRKYAQGGPVEVEVSEGDAQGIIAIFGHVTGSKGTNVTDDEILEAVSEALEQHPWGRVGVNEYVNARPQNERQQLLTAMAHLRVDSEVQSMEDAFNAVTDVIGRRP
jgi:MoxR-like ATPase